MVRWLGLTYCALCGNKQQRSWVQSGGRRVRDIDAHRHDSIMTASFLFSSLNTETPEGGCDALRHVAWGWLMLSKRW